MAKRLNTHLNIKAGLGPTKSIACLPMFKVLKNFVFLLTFVLIIFLFDSTFGEIKFRRNTKVFIILHICKHSIDVVGSNPPLTVKCVFKRLTNQESLPYLAREDGEKSLEVARLKCLFPT